MDIFCGNDDFSLFHGQTMVTCLVYVKRGRVKQWAQIGQNGFVHDVFAIVSNASPSLDQ